MSESSCKGDLPAEGEVADVQRSDDIKRWSTMVRELFTAHELVWRLFVRDFAARYRQTLLGVLWAIIMPLVVVGTFIFLNSSGVLNIGEIEIPYPAYALLGLTFWQIFAGGIVNCSNSIVKAGTMVAKIKFPREALVVSSLGQTFVETMVRAALVVLAFAYYQVVPAWTTVLLPLAVLPVILFTLGLGFFLSLVNAVMRDVANVVNLLTTFLLFLTPVLYPEPETEVFRVFTRFNPLAPLVNGPRDLVIRGEISDPWGFTWASILAVVLFVVGWRFFYLAQMRMAERMGGR